jgi:nucleoside-diphosphate kinase
LATVGRPDSGSSLALPSPAVRSPVETDPKLARICPVSGTIRTFFGVGPDTPVAFWHMSDRTLVLLKPDAVERKLVGEIVSRFEAKNLDIVAMDIRTLDADTLARHYEEHVGKGFYGELVEFMSRGPVVAMVIEGPEDTWEVVRAMMGATNPRTAAPGTIRGDLGILFTENLVHGSDSLASAEREIGIFFPNL